MAKSFLYCIFNHIFKILIIVHFTIVHLQVTIFFFYLSHITQYLKLEGNSSEVCQRWWWWRAEDVVVCSNEVISHFCVCVCYEGNEDSMSKISELIRPLQMTEGEKVELLSVKPSFLSRSTPSSPRRAFLSEVRPVIATAVSITKLLLLLFTWNVIHGLF